MSFSPSLSLVRLQELKLWQGSFENLFQRTNDSTRPSDFESIEGISALDSSVSSAFSPEKRQTDVRDWDKQEISPSKPFEVLLEEKIAEDKPLKMTDKPKRPFLRKGEGLARFRMSSGSLIGQKRGRSGFRRQSSMPEEDAKTGFTEENTKNIAPQKRGILKHVNTQFSQNVDLSPLTVPTYVKPRGTWKSVFEETEDCSAKEKNDGTGYNGLDKGGEYDRVDKHSCSRPAEMHIVETPRNYVLERGKNNGSTSENNNYFNRHLIIDKINQYALKRIYKSKDMGYSASNSIPEMICEISTPKSKKEPGEATLYEQQMEKELKIFETLERKVENSSFCSTNTSITNLLSSTPQKVRNYLEKGNFVHTEIMENTVPRAQQCENIQQKLQEVAEKTDVLQNFLINLRNMEQKTCIKTPNHISESTTKNSTKSSQNTSFSDEERWSTRSPSPISNYTELDSTCQSDGWKKVDAAVNTSFDVNLEETVRELSCKDCDDLRKKLAISNKDFDVAKSENARLKIEIREYEKKVEKLRKDMDKMEKKHQEAMDTVREELESERKKLIKEKNYFEMYVKEHHNKTTKKEREEITHLKQELADAKELIKLKDTKNGATLARLRTQVKQQEKEVSELKITVEKLQRENAKLSASQKYVRRPTEVKMLHEINKNLSRLTEETFKKQLSKSGNGDGDEAKKGKNDIEGNEKENDSEKHCAKEPAKKSFMNRSRKDSVKNESALDLTNSDNLSIEKQYESVFGSIDSPRNSNSSTNIEKTEKTLPDGSIEITYSNGNVKTIAPDGQFVKMIYFNGDTKETNLKEKTIKYHYALVDSWHTQYPDGTEILEYSDGQKCKKCTNGSQEISYPDGSKRIINPDGTEEQNFPDGRKTIKNAQGEQIILLPNGQKEIHTKDFKRREYPDGTTRTLHKDGTVETRYANGRVRMKDATGTLIMDTHQEVLT